MGSYLPWSICKPNMKYEVSSFSHTKVREGSQNFKRQSCDPTSCFGYRSKSLPKCSQLLLVLRLLIPKISWAFIIHPQLFELILFSSLKCCISQCWKSGKIYPGSIFGSISVSKSSRLFLFLWHTLPKNFIYNCLSNLIKCMKSPYLSMLEKWKIQSWIQILTNSSLGDTPSTHKISWKISSQLFQ